MSEEIAESLREISTPTGLSYSGDRTLNNSYTEKIIDYITNLQQKVEQLEKEVNKYQKELEKADSITQSCIFQGKQESKISFRKCLNRLEQLENIRKEVIDYIKNDSYFDGSSICANDLLNILNKGDNKE